ncbi:MAG TPA: hypothetical protein DCM49_05985 [Lachnospiraceae bacterium]|nr:hypothetical protein [Lachnospiraceae bacterium]
MTEWRVWTMNRINILGYSLDYMSVENAMNTILEYIKNDHLNTIGLITRNSFLRCSEKEWWVQYMMTLDLGIIGESDILAAAGIDRGQVFDDVEENRYLDRFFWQMIRLDQGFYILEDEQETGEMLASYLKNNYPGIRILGVSGASGKENSSPDKIINHINSVFPDVIISGLKGDLQDRFILRHQNKILGKLWLNLGESPELQKAVGIRRGWLQERKIRKSFRQILNKKI